MAEIAQVYIVPIPGRYTPQRTGVAGQGRLGASLPPCPPRGVPAHSDKQAERPVPPCQADQPAGRSGVPQVSLAKCRPIVCLVLPGIAPGERGFFTPRECTREPANYPQVTHPIFNHDTPGGQGVDSSPRAWPGSAGSSTPELRPNIVWGRLRDTIWSTHMRPVDVISP